MKISDITESFNTYSGQNIPQTYSSPNEFSTVTQIGDREIRFVAGRLSDEDWDIDDDADWIDEVDVSDPHDIEYDR